MKRRVTGLIFSVISKAAFGLSAKDATVEELKSKIQKIASENQTRTDNSKDVRSQLEPLVKELVERKNNPVNNGYPINTVHGSSFGPMMSMTECLTTSLATLIARAPSKSSIPRDFSTM